MNYIQLNTCDVANGEGLRVSLFVAGCARKCRGCFNPESHDPCAGKPFTGDVKKCVFQQLEKPYVDGFSILGGEPLSYLSDNRQTVISLCREIKEKFPNKTIWLWTGYYLEEVKTDSAMSEILNYVDIVVDGPFIQDQKDLSLAFRGSANQRILRKGIDF